MNSDENQPEIYLANETNYLTSKELIENQLENFRNVSKKFTYYLNGRVNLNKNIMEIIFSGSLKMSIQMVFQLISSRTR